MKPNRFRKFALAGVLLVTSAMAIGYQIPPGAEPAPMEAVFRGQPEASVAAPVASEATWDLPVTRNEPVNQWIGFLAGRNASKTRLWLERSGRYTPMIKEQLRARGMPEDLVYLAFIESGFSPKAYSSAAASGIWQFIAETGRRYGLEVSQYVDERRDPIASTDAALDYLEELHGRFGSWYLAAAAYNTGENRVERILRERVSGMKGSDQLFWYIAPYLPAETRNYVPLMLAAGHIGKSPEEFGFDTIAYQEPLAYDTAWIPAQASLGLVARAAGVEEAAVTDLNPHLMKGVTPPGRAWPVRIPVGTQAAFEQRYASLYQSERELEKKRVTLAAATTTTTKKITVAKRATHVVRHGDNLTVIAKRNGITVHKLQSLNGLGRKSKIYPGQKIRVG